MSRRLTRPVVGGDLPPPVLEPAGVPVDGVDVDAPGQQPFGDGDPQAAVTGRLALAAYGPRHRLGSDVRALGQDGRGEPLDPVHRQPGHPGHLLETGAGSDPRLDVTWAEGGFHLDLQLSEPRAVAAHRRAEPIVRRNCQFFAAVGGHDQGLAILAQSDQSRGAHRWGSSLSVFYGWGSSWSTYSAEAAGCGRRFRRRRNLSP